MLIPIPILLLTVNVLDVSIVKSLVIPIATAVTLYPLITTESRAVGIHPQAAPPEEIVDQVPVTAVASFQFPFALAYNVVCDIE